MKVFNYLTITAIIFIMLGVAANGSSLTADEILRSMDDHRLISNDFEMSIRVESHSNNHFEGATVMKGYVNNGKMTTLIFLEPANMKGRKVLIKGNDMWLDFPKRQEPHPDYSLPKINGGHILW